MTTQEFKAWFEGFSEGIEGKPTQAQWERIRARVSEIDGLATSYPVFIERYPQIRLTPAPSPYWWGTTIGSSPVTVSGAIQMDSKTTVNAFTALGAAEASSTH